jgi:lactoylglutathione lyase
MSDGRYARLKRISVHGLFEVHLTVADLDKAIAFYGDVVGLRPAHVEPARQVAFFWVGPAGHAILGLWAAGPAPQKVTSHTAFRVSLADVLAAPGALRAAGVTPLDFDGRPTDQPIVFTWMPAVAVFFRDPDGHLVEYIAMLPQEPRAEYGIMPWRMWVEMHRANSLQDWPALNPIASDSHARSSRPTEYSRRSFGLHR